MPSEGSVTAWIEQLKAGDPSAAQKLWQRYFERLVAMARTKLRNAPRRAADEEDVALSAFDSFCRGAGHGRFPLLGDRDDLWQLLVVLTARKAADLVQHECRQKRGGGAVRNAGSLAASDSCASESLFDHLPSSEPTPHFAAQVAEEYRRLLDRLGEEQLRLVALRKMEGCTTEEIAVELGCAPRTVERKLKRIRRLWAEENTP